VILLAKVLKCVWLRSITRTDFNAEIVARDYFPMLKDREAENVICRQSIHDEASLIPSRNSVDHGASIRRSVPTQIAIVFFEKRNVC
jgi:hypothetical protein